VKGQVKFLVVAVDYFQMGRSSIACSHHHSSDYRLCEKTNSMLFQDPISHSLRQRVVILLSGIPAMV
jgi:hypothetical protein